MNQVKSLSAVGWPSPIEPVVIAGMPVAPLSTQQWTELMVADCAAARAGRQAPRYHAAINGNAISNFASNLEFRQAILQADAIAADGVPVMWAARWLAGTAIPDRAATTDLFHDLAATAQEHGLSMYFLGSTPEENAASVAAVRKLYPNLIIAGAHHGYYAPDEEPAILRDIVAAKTDVLWIALGLPREDAFAIRNREALAGVGWIKTCGGLFNFLSGLRSRAPMWMQRWGLEWLYRLALEPRRLFWRYAMTNAHAAWLIVTGTPRAGQRGRA